MRLDNYLMENKFKYADAFTNKQRKAIEEIVVKCSQYFEEFGDMAKKGRFFWRGIKGGVKDIAIKTPRKDRRPKDTEFGVHQIVDNELKKTFGWKPRSEGVFAVANENFAVEYGTACIVIPANGYKYVYSKDRKYYDMYSVFSEYSIKYIGVWYEELEDEYYEKYQPVWTSDLNNKKYTYLGDVENLMDRLGYERAGKGKITPKNIQYKNIKNGKIINWVYNTPKGPTLDKYIEQRENEIRKENILEVTNKAKEYIKTCTDKDAVTLLRNNSKIELMLKCKYYYLINERFLEYLKYEFREYELR